MTATELPYGDVPGQTHWDGCWRARGHHNCAVREIERLRAAPREPGEAERLIGEWHSARCAEGLAWRATKEATNDQQHSTAVRAHEQASQRLIRAEDAMQQFAAKQVSAPRPDAGDGREEP